MDHVVALLDPSKIKFSVAAECITAEKFWKRLCEERWQINQINAHGMSYKRMYVERHIQSLLENYYPAKVSDNMQRLLTELDAGRAFVHSIRLQQLPSRVDLSTVLPRFTNLSTLELKYGATKLGMDYDKSAFGIQLTDAMGLAKLLAETKTLNRLTLSENLLNDESVHILMSGLMKNDTITYLDLSHNKIGDPSAKRLCKLLEGQSVLTHLNLEDNKIRSEGAVAIGHSLARNSVLQSFSMRLNAIGDEGAVEVLSGVMRNKMLKSLDIGCTEMKAGSVRSVEQLLRSNQTLTHLDISSNDIYSDGGKSFTDALENNRSLISVEARRCGLSEEVQQQLTKALVSRQAADKRAKRKAQETAEGGWDEP